MEILDGDGFEMVQVEKGGSGVAGEGSIPNIPLPEGVRSTPCMSVSGQTLYASFLYESNLRLTKCLR